MDATEIAGQWLAETNAAMAIDKPLRELQAMTMVVEDLRSQGKNPDRSSVVKSSMHIQAAHWEIILIFLTDWMERKDLCPTWHSVRSVAEQAAQLRRPHIRDLGPRDMFIAW